MFVPTYGLGQESSIYMNVCNKLECLSPGGNFKSGIMFVGKARSVACEFSQ